MPQRKPVAPSPQSPVSAAAATTPQATADIAISLEAKGPSYAEQEISQVTAASPEQQNFYGRNKKKVNWGTVIVLIVIFAIAVGGGVGGRHRHHSYSSSDSSDGDCTPPGGQMCETSGDCSDVSDFSSCLLACDGYSYCT